jgi:signal transduction histidine kinase
MDLEYIRGELLPAVLADLPLPPGVAASVLDGEGKVISGTAGSRGLELAKDTLGDALPFYQSVVFLEDLDLLSRQTDSTRRLHQWIMIASITGILAAGWFVGRTVAGELKVAKLKSDFLSNVTHELKTPLTSIRMFVEMLQEGRVKDEGERREYLGVISREADRLTGLIQRVLDLARFEGRKSEGLKLAPTDLGRLARDTADLFRLRMGESEATLRVEVPDEVRAGMLDQGAIQEVILNLLGNAMKYGGREVLLSVSVKGGVATIEVADDGIGISEDDQKMIFEKFYRADESLARQVEGSGLGLALVSQIVKAHRGKIRVRSEKGQGSTFTITLPLNG